MMNVFFEGVPVIDDAANFSLAGRLKPKGFQRRFGYFAAEGKVTRVGARNIPFIT